MHELYVRCQMRRLHKLILDWIIAWQMFHLQQLLRHKSEGFLVIKLAHFEGYWLRFVFLCRYSPLQTKQGLR